MKGCTGFCEHPCPLHPAPPPEAGEALAPCPFCGSDFVVIGPHTEGSWRIQCGNVDCALRPSTVNRAVERARAAWNRRAAPPAQGRGVGMCWCGSKLGECVDCQAFARAVPRLSEADVTAALEKAAPGANELHRDLTAAALRAPRDLRLGAAPQEPAQGRGHWMQSPENRALLTEAIDRLEKRTAAPQEQSATGERGEERSPCGHSYYELRTVCVKCIAAAEARGAERERAAVVAWLDARKSSQWTPWGLAREIAGGAHHLKERTNGDR